jgi:lambda family phage portal protein
MMRDQRVQASNGNWLDRAVGWFAPQLGLRRARARMLTGVVQRHYEAASSGRRTSGWLRSPGDAAAVSGPYLARLREHARDLVRNNGYAESALTTICDHVVGWGITAKPRTTNRRVHEVWKAWAESSDCDSDGRHDLYGLQHLVLRSVIEAGEVLIRRRLRFPDEGLPIPLQLQVLDPDFLDTDKVGSQEIRNGEGQLVGRNVILHGIEFDILGRRRAYWLFREHPGSALGLNSAASVRIPAESILHVYRHDRPGQVRGVSWFAPVLLRFKDFDEFEDATLMKQKVAACLAVVMTTPDGSMTALGTPNIDQSPEWDHLEPGSIISATPGQEVEVVQPPTVSEYQPYATAMLRAIATGLGVSYEDLTGDFSQVNFSSARMSRIRHWQRVEGWRWRMLIPQMCEPVWRWAMEAAQVVGADGAVELEADWTGPPLPMVDPDKEGLAYMRLVRAGLMSRQEAVRERGYDPAAVLAEIAADNRAADALGVILDSDPRNTTQAGNPRQTQAAGNVSTFQEPEPKPAPSETDDEDDEDEQEEEDEEEAERVGA